ncbi:protein RRP6-like 2 [Sesamum angolense]|uniref:Protein RRP6-like 2 n=1 Tax=Sesamum angolense TaxID=2727404 RepID=A0AAE2BT21_9LAMI|nr:protein RRP6-like 2 [Sesamum angolense]
MMSQSYGLISKMGSLRFCFPMHSPFSMGLIAQATVASSSYIDRLSLDDDVPWRKAIWLRFRVLISMLSSCSCFNLVMHRFHLIMGRGFRNNCALCVRDKVGARSCVHWLWLKLVIPWLGELWWSRFDEIVSVADPLSFAWSTNAVMIYALNFMKKELLTDTSYLYIYGLQCAELNAQQLAVVSQLINGLQGLCELRDAVARAEDESTGYVLPNRTLIEIGVNVSFWLKFQYSYSLATSNIIANEENTLAAGESEELPSEAPEILKNADEADNIPNGSLLNDPSVSEDTGFHTVSGHGKL